MNRAYSLLEIKRVDEDAREITGWATTPEADRMNDVVDPEGAKFKLPIPLLWQHDAGDPIGQVIRAKVSKAGIEIVAKIARGVTDEIDRKWSLIKAGLVPGFSIGFKPTAQEPIAKTNGIRFKTWNWLELSCVTIPANASASITTIRSIDTAQRAASGHNVSDVKLTSPGASGSISLNRPEGTKMKTIAEQITQLEAKRMASAARMESVMQKSIDEDRTADDAEGEEFDTLKDEVAAIDKQLGRLRDIEKTHAQSARPLARVGSARDAAETRSHVITVRAPMEKGVGFIRLFGARYLARQQGVSPAEIARAKGWGDDIEAVLRMPADIVQRAAVAAGTTTDPVWAAPLVTLQNLTSEFIELLYAASVLNRIPGLTRVPFNIRVPREVTGAAASWVGEGKPKPVSAMAFDSVTLTHNKIAGIVGITEELMRFSSPSAEPLIRNSLVQAITKLVDVTFLDPTVVAVAGVSPASVTNGVTAIPSTGGTPEALRADLYTLLATYAAANQSTYGLVLVMRSSLALGIGMSRNAFGSKEFPDMTKDGGTLEGIPVVASQNVPSGAVIAINAPMILMADDGGVDFSHSTEASLQMDSAPDSPATATTVTVSLWQHNMVGIRAERFITWLKARAGAVQYLAGVTITPSFDEEATLARLREEEETSRRTALEDNARRNAVPDSARNRNRDAER
ncbi:MAG: phage major capsid protein [Hyphomicrobiaceae bacterium]|nr:MAG: phage major capsid protein [Hyphomicrobiaceae bacterium]